MPFNLVIVMSPRVVFMNGDGDILVHRPLPNDDYDYCEVVKEKTDECCYKVNIDSYLLQTLENLYNQGLLCSSPNVVEDDRKNSVQRGLALDTVMNQLAHIGVGSIVGSVNVLALELSKFHEMLPTGQENGPTEKRSGNQCTGVSQDYASSQISNGFLDSTSKIRVEQVTESIETSAAFTFDYLCLLLVSSVIAGIGLARDNSVAIVASMLVSPIMGPVLALAFGSLIHNSRLTLLGLKNELTSLAICILIGYATGIVVIFVGTEENWPTPEMRNRGMTEGLLVGLAIAIPSGVGVALSVLGNNNSSLVGVAISASLLPPAVNCGMAFAYASVGFSLDSGAKTDDSIHFSTPMSYTLLGAISLSLTLVNIGAIYLSALVMLRIKEVAPVASKKAFWHEDIKAFRDYNRAHTVALPTEPSSIDTVTSNSHMTSDELTQRKPQDNCRIAAFLRRLFFYSFECTSSEEGISPSIVTPAIVSDIKDRYISDAIRSLGTEGV